jgi:hypothetical protein
VSNPLTALFERCYRELRPRAPIPQFRVDFYPFTGINNTIRLRGECVLVRLSDILEGAPESVLHAIAHILIAKLYRKPIDPSEDLRYRRHINSRAVRDIAERIRQLRGRKRIEGAQGGHYDLDEVFEDLNRRFFYGLLARPRMTWSGHDARNSLGHYDPAHNAIVISRVFDSPRVPRYAVEYIVYHEMLHLKHPVKVRGTRRCVHPRAFQDDEKLFPDLDKVKAFLKML